MKLSKYAKNHGLTYRTAYNHFKAGLIENAYQLPSGTVIIKDVAENVNSLPKELKVATYARVSTSENKSNMETQSDRIVSFANAKGYKISKIVKEIASGLNDKRPKLIDLLNDKSIDIIIVEHTDRLTRFGFNYIQTLMELDGRKIEVINPPSNDKEDLLEDFISVITSFCARIYGQRRSKRNTEKLISELS